MRKEVLRMERVSCQSQGVMQLDSLSLNIFEGEIVGLVPLNLYGVETLVNVLCRNLPLYYGFVYYRERLINTWRHGCTSHSPICLIQDRSSLAPDLSVLENVFVLDPSHSAGFINFREIREYYQVIEDKLGICLSPDAGADSLSTYERVLVELMKAVNTGSRLVILWDAGTFVNSGELKKLHSIMRMCTRDGMSFLYITPHLEETEELCDRTLSIYNGKIIKSLEHNMKRPEVFPTSGNWKYFKLVRDQILRKTPPDQEKTPALELQHVSTPEISDLSLQVHPGECLVIQDMNDCINGALLQMMQKKIRHGGRILISGNTDFTSRSFALVQENATESMLFPDLSYMDNLYFTLNHKFRRIWYDRRLRQGIMRDMEPILGREVFKKPLHRLTENEKYSLVYARILIQHPSVVFCVQPFKGAEMDSRMHICRQLDRLLKAGIAVVILTVSLGDSLVLADRVMQIHTGEIVRQYRPEEFVELPDSTPWRRLYEDIANGHWESGKPGPEGRKENP